MSAGHLVKRLLIVALLLLPLPLRAQEAPTLVPYSDQAFKIQAVIPDGWTKAGPGLYARGSSASDVALVALQAAPLDTATLWTSLLPQLALDAVPESIGGYDSAVLSWTLYQIDVTQGGVSVRVDLALAEAEGTTYIALLQAAPDEYDALHAAVFVPVLEAFAPLVVEEGALPYLVEEVTFENGEVTLAGTLTIPEKAGRHPAVVLMTGSGAQNRDEIVVPGFPIFKLIADDLTRRGVAVLRYDDRGVGGSMGDYSAASIQDLASDGRAAVAYLKTRADIDPTQVGLLGHSEGGIYAALLGADPESGVAFIISVAGTAVPGRDLLLLQNELLLRSAGASDAQVEAQMEFLNAMFPLAAERDWEGVENLLYETRLEQWDLLAEEERAASGHDNAEGYARQASENFVSVYASEWFATLLEYNPGDDWARTTVPVLAIFGGLDLQVDAEQNAAPLEAALEAAGNPDFSVVTLERANHLFQEAGSGAIEEYGVLPAEFIDTFLPTIGDWLASRVEIIE